MRVLVTGHQGYIGTVLVPMLIEQGHKVVGLDSDLFAGATFSPLRTDVPSIRKDIRDVELADVEGFDAIMHLAGLSNDPLGNLNPELTYEINHRASVRLAAVAREVGVSRYIFASSCSNYGAAGDELLDETATFNPVTPYGRSKVLVEQDITRLADASFSPTFLRNATAFGVSPRLRFDLVLNNLAAWAYTTGRVLIKSDGTPWRPVVHIEDIARAFIAVLHAPREVVHTRAFNVGRNEDNYQIRQLAEIVCEVIPQSRVEYAVDADDPEKRKFNVGKDTRNYRVNCSLIQEAIPTFKPQWNARRGAEELYEAYQRAGLTREEFEGPRYQRVAHLKQLLSQGRLRSDLRWSPRSESNRKA
jgi:nucleoside-diphosphate-sugar epimerase